MSGHTPGPWDFSWKIQPNGCPTVGHKGLMVCMVAHSAKDLSQKQEALANAALISAAPCMLEALEGALKYVAFAYSEGMEGAEQAGRATEAAIARAKGEQV